jgi:sodium pump decarboxylase gamma subunit
MLTNLLANKTITATIPEALLYALIGFIVVFLGIAFLIFVIWLVGKIMNPTKKTATTKEGAIDKPIAASTPKALPTDEVDEETVAVIMAALTAYYENNYPKCEFTVKRIKRIRRNDYA